MSTTSTKCDHEVVSKNDWLEARRELLAKEKELTHLSDEISRQRQQLPWTVVDKKYAFNGPQGPLSLGDLFGGRSQLAVYHFMFGEDWTEGCPGCSYLMDHMDGAIQHLRARDVALVLASGAPVEKLAAFQKRMGWHFQWVSSAGSDFNHDFGVAFSKDEIASGKLAYNFGTTAPHGEENPGMSCFHKDASGAIYHTYSAYGRGLESMIGTYAVLDRAPLGRNEESLPAPMSWVRHHDKYEPTLEVAGSCCHKKDGH